MNKLRTFNEQIFERSLKLSNKDELACPNLVSSKRFLYTINSNPILYLGQETNCWVNYTKDVNSLDEVEEAYDRFVIDRGTSSKSCFWQFISKTTNIDYRYLYKSIVWSNTLLMGKRKSSGAPDVDQELSELSLENLLFLYDYFKPRAVIFANGNNNPYWFITNKFLGEIGSNLVDKWPTGSEPLLIDDKNNIFWTFHPRRLQYQKGKFKETSEKIYQKLK